MNIGYHSYQSPALSPPDPVEVDESPYIDRLVASAEFFGDTVCDHVSQLRTAYLANDPIALQKWIGDLLGREASKTLRQAEDRITAFSPKERELHDAYEAACRMYEQYDKRAA